jgi:hypothetical protein
MMRKMEMDMFQTRTYTNRLLEAVEEGVINRDMLIQTLVMWLSESDVKEMVLANDLQGALIYEDEDEEIQDED